MILGGIRDRFCGRIMRRHGRAILESYRSRPQRREAKARLAPRGRRDALFAGWSASGLGRRRRVQAGGHAGGSADARALVLPIALGEKISLVGVLILVLIVELLNSAIEAAVDRDSLEINPLGKRAKDVGSAAVMLALMFAGGTWVAIVGWYFFRT